MDENRLVTLILVATLALCSAVLGVFYLATRDGMQAVPVKAESSLGASGTARVAGKRVPAGPAPTSSRD